MKYLRSLLIYLLAIQLLTSTAFAAAPAEELVLTHHVLTHSGTVRRYALYIPPNLDSKKASAPLVLVLHGGGGNGENAAFMTGFTEKAQQEGFIVAYPYGSGRMNKRLLTWNADHCCGYAMTQEVDDVGFLNQLMDELIDQHPVDANRIYVTGLSNGGMMTHRVGIELSHKIAAIAPVIAALFGDEMHPTHALPALFINGAIDESVPINGGPPGGTASSSWDGTPVMPAEYQSTFWAKANGCKPTPTRTATRKRNAQIFKWEYHCPMGAEVVRYLISDNGHAWPGGESGRRRGDKPSNAMNATDVIWDFFAAHSL